MKCPSCGFEAPEGAAWCDFCKHPFRKEKAASSPSAPQAPAPPPPQEPRLKALLEQLPEEVRAKLPANLEAAAGAEERIQGVSREVRLLAWAFLGFWFVLATIVGGLLLGRYRLLKQEARETASPQNRP